MTATHDAPIPANGQLRSTVLFPTTDRSATSCTVPHIVDIASATSAHYKIPRTDVKSR